MNEPVTAVIPIKRLGNVKRRLATRLRSWERAALVLRLFDRQVKILAAMPEIERVIVVTADTRVKTLAEMRGAVVALQPDEGVNAAIQAGIDEAFDAGATAVLAIHADLPFIEAIDVRELLGASAPSVFAIAPDRRKRGTNAIVLRRGMDIELQFGVDSCHRFLAASELAEIPVQQVVRPGLGFDLDLPADLLEYRARVRGSDRISNEAADEALIYQSLETSQPTSRIHLDDR